MATQKERPNRLLHGFILISLGIHVLIFFHVAGIYENKAISYIELSMQEISNPNVRVIPKPRIRETAPKISKIKTIQVKSFHVPRIKIEPVFDHKTDHAYERIKFPQLPEDMNVSNFFVPDLNIQGQAAIVEAHEEQIEFTTAKEYFEMLNLRIHSVKEYPESAKSRHLEGRVKVQFVVSRNGILSDIKIIKSSHHKNLDNAAIRAIKKASPFPRPPAFIFKPPITMQISILFELV
jgi:periplasmic protein TonB